MRGSGSRTPTPRLELIGGRELRQPKGEIPVEWIEHWLNNGETPVPLPPPAIPRQPSPVPSDWSGSSHSTVTERNYNGFLSLNPPMGTNGWLI